MSKILKYPIQEIWCMLWNTISHYWVSNHLNNCIIYCIDVWSWYIIFLFKFSIYFIYIVIFLPHSNSFHSEFNFMCLSTLLLMLTIIKTTYKIYNLQERQPKYRELLRKRVIIANYFVIILFSVKFINSSYFLSCTLPCMTLPSG